MTSAITNTKPRKDIMTTMDQARKMHREATRKRQTKTVTRLVKEDGDIVEKDVHKEYWGDKKKNYTSFRKWARQNADRFSQPLSPKLASIVGA